MSTTTFANLEKLLDGPRDNALLRYSLGIEALKNGEADRAVQFFRDSLLHNKHYSAAWKSLGLALTESGEHEEAEETYQVGIRIAEEHGDVQAAKEMRIFLKRIVKEDWL